MRPDPTLLASCTALLLAAARLDLVPKLRGPAPWPPEWQWGYAPLALDASIAWPAALGAVAVLLLALSGRRFFVRNPHWLRRAGTLIGCAMPLALLAPVDLPVRELLRRTVHGSFTSYHKVATGRAAADPGRFLREHARLLPTLRKGTPHAATHPPGPVLHFRAWLELARRKPAWTDAITERLRGLGVDPAALDPPQRPDGLVAAALGAATLLALCGLVPLLASSLARDLGASELEAGRLALLAPLLPGLALMTPSLDQALAAPVLLVAIGIARADRSDAMWPAIGGATAGAAAFFSYGAPVLAAPAALATVAASRPGWRWLLAAAAGFAALFALPMAFGHDPIASAQQGLALHRETFTLPRSRLLWMAWNPLDVAVFLGLPLAVHLLAEAHAQRAPFARVLGLSVLLLLLAGSVRGEAGRILVPLMPPLLIAATGTLRRTAAASASVGALLAWTALGLRLSWQLP